MAQKFIDGVLLCLEVICLHDDPVVADEIVGEICSLKDLEDAAKRTGSINDMRTIKWLKDNHIK